MARAVPARETKPSASMAPLEFFFSARLAFLSSLRSSLVIVDDDGSDDGGDDGKQVVGLGFNQPLSTFHEFLMCA